MNGDFLLIYHRMCQIAHDTVNQTDNFFNPNNGAHTQVGSIKDL